MEEFNVRYAMHVHDPEQLKEIKAQECQTMMHGLLKNAAVMKRYLDIFGHCLTSQQTVSALNRYCRLTALAAEQRRKLARVLYQPPVQLQIDNC